MITVSIGIKLHLDIDIDVLKHQKEFIESKATNPSIIGGLGSGKTEAGIIRIILLTLIDKVNTLYMMPTFDLLRLRALPGVQETLINIGVPVETIVNKSSMYIELIGYGRVYFRSYDNPDRIIAFSVGHCIVDEIDTLNKEKASLVWRKVTERVRDHCPSTGFNTIGCVTTPDQGLNGFVYDRWVKNKKDGYELIKASTYDNTFLPAGYTDQILANYDPILADLYLRGEFVSLTQNKQFWAFNRVKHHSDEVLNGDETLIQYAIDFNVGGTCFVFFKRAGDKLIAVREGVAMNTQDALTKIDAISDAKKIAFPDATGGNESANADITSLGLIKNARHRVNAPAANPSVRASINSVNNLLSKDRLLVNTKECPLLTEALESLGYDDKNKPEKFNTHPSTDDFGDLTRYIVHRLYPVRRPTINSIRR